MTALVGALRVSLAADTANFEAGMKRAQRQTAASASAIQKSMGLIKTAVAGFVSGLSVGLFVDVIKHALQYAGSLAEVAQQLGVTTRDLQTFRFAAGQVGVEQSQLETGLQKLTITLGKVAAGAEAPTKALKAIGITAEQIKGKDAGEAFRMIADGLQKVTDRSQRAAVEVALFGKSGAQLDNLLSGGSEALNELSAAAEKLGIVLSDDQIQRADETADKLEALKTVLAANIASAVADNTDAILGLANALVVLVRSVAQAVQGWRLMVAEFNAFGGAIGQNIGAAFHGGNFANPFTVVNDVSKNMKLAQEFARIRANGLYEGAGRKSVPVGADIGKFLAPGGGGGKKGRAARPDHSAEDALRDSYQFDQELRRAQMDVLRAQQDLAADYIERTTIGIEILNAEKDAYEAELKYQTALFDLTKGKEGLSQAQAAQLKAANDTKDSLERQALLQEEQEQRQRDVFELGQHDLDRRKEVLQSQDQIATTFAERRKIELELLEIAYEQKKQALEYTIATSKDIAAVEDARRDLLNLNKTHAADRQGVMNSTRGPLESYLAGIPSTAAQINEAFEGIGVNAIDGLIGKLTDLEGGFKHLGATALEQGKEIAQMFLQLALRMLFLKAITGFAGSASGGFDTSVIAGNSAAMGVAMPMASGGFVSGPGSSTSDSVPAMLSNGEFVVNAGAVRKWLPLLAAINGDEMPHMKGGGLLNVVGAFGGIRGLAAAGAFGGGKGRFLGAFSPAAFLQLKELSFLGKAVGLGIPHFASGGLVNGLPISGPSYGAMSMVGPPGVSPPMALTFNNDFRGADANAVSAIEARLNRFQAEMPYQVVQAYYDAVSRNVIR